VYLIGQTRNQAKTITQKKKKKLKNHTRFICRIIITT